MWLRWEELFSPEDRNNSSKGQTSETHDERINSLGRSLTTLITLLTIFPTRWQSFLVNTLQLIIRVLVLQVGHALPHRWILSLIRASQKRCNHSGITLGPCKFVEACHMEHSQWLSTNELRGVRCEVMYWYTVDTNSIHIEYNTEMREQIFFHVIVQRNLFLLEVNKFGSECMASSFPVRVSGIIPARECLIPPTMLMHFALGWYHLTRCKWKVFIGLNTSTLEQVKLFVSLLFSFLITFKEVMI